MEINIEELTDLIKDTHTSLHLAHPYFYWDIEYGGGVSLGGGFSIGADKLPLGLILREGLANFDPINGNFIFYTSKFFKKYSKETLLNFEKKDRRNLPHNLPLSLSNYNVKINYPEFTKELHKPSTQVILRMDDSLRNELIELMDKFRSIVERNQTKYAH